MPVLAVHHQLPEPIQTHVHGTGDAIQPSHPVIPFSSCLQSFLASRSFPRSQLLHQAAKVLEFQLQHQSFQWIFSTDLLYMDWLDPLAVQRTLKSLLQYHSPKASILRHWAFFTVQLSHPYVTTGKTIALTRWTFVSKGICFLICCLGWSYLSFQGVSIF